MELSIALAGIFATETKLRSSQGMNDPHFMSLQMMVLSQYTAAAEEKLAEYERDFEQTTAKELKIRLIDNHMKVTQAEREVDIETAELKGQLKYLTRVVKSAWAQIGVIQSRINHLVRESQTV